MQAENQRLYRLYSYDDPLLVAYWKLDESYQADDIFYVINDYSSNQNTFNYSINSDSTYPQFYNDSSNTLSLCFYHDVKTCLSVDYSNIPPIAQSNQKYLSPPTF